jgi:phospholipase/carboxylesterase
MNDLCLKYLEYFKGDEDSSVKTLILFLHGRAANEVDLFDLAAQLEIPAIVLSVRAPIEMASESYGWFHTKYQEDGSPLHDAAEAELARQLLIKFIGQSQSKYKVRPDATYLLGFSQGAIMALGIVTQTPEIVGGIVALSGRILPEHARVNKDASALKNLPVLLSHGIDDMVLSVEYARSSRVLLQQLQVQLTYFEYSMGHDVTDLNFLDVKKWFNRRHGL